MKARCVVVAVVLSGIALPARAANPPLLFVMDFESGDLSQWPGRKLPRPDSARVVTTPVRAGRYAAEFVLRRSDSVVSDGKRAELVVDGIGEVGGEYWYGFSTMIPGDWRPDTKAGEVVAQWKGRPDSDLGESSDRSPSLALRVKGEKWRITVQTDPSPVTRDNGAPRRTVWQGKFTRDAWDDWVFHVRWSCRRDGLLQIWKNGKRIASWRGPNAYNDKGKMYLKIGIYKPGWNDPAAPSDVDTRRIFHDEVRIGGAKADYAAVSPP